VSTRSAIIEKTADGTYRGVYCHFDGYPAGVGKTLLNHYQDAAKVSALIDLGEISQLDIRVAPEAGEAHSFNRPAKGVTTAYGRDRGEDSHGPHEGRTVREVESHIGHNGHVYVFADGAWTHNELPLADEVAAYS
jgi:hypothetical protein